MEAEKEEKEGDDFRLNIKLLVPVEGSCPKCGVLLLWGDLVKFRNRRFAQTDEVSASSDEDDRDLSECDSDYQQESDLE